MKNVTEFKEFRGIKRNTLNETVLRMDDVYRVRTSVDIPASLVSAFIKKVKDESGKNIREFYSDMELSEMMADYLKASFMNIENFPTSIALGTETTGAQPIVQGQPAQTQGQPAQIQTPAEGQNVQAQSTAQKVPAQEGQAPQGQAPQRQTPQGQAPQGQASQGGQTQAI